MKGEYWVTNKPEIFALTEEKSDTNALEMLQQVYGDDDMSCTCFWVA